MEVELSVLDVDAVCALGVTARPVRGGSGATSGITSSPHPPHLGAGGGSGNKTSNLRLSM